MRDAFSIKRVGAMLLRYSYLLRASYTRILDIIYWPLVQMLTWGFLQTYLVKAGALQAPGGAAQAAGTLIGAILLWDILLRGQQGFSFSFIEEMWSRNLPNILMSPLRPPEFIVSLILMSILRLFVGVVPVTLMAILFFGFNLWALGVAFGAFFVVLMFFAWSIGLLVSGILLRYGLGAENLVWSLMFFVQPLGAVYYPVSTLPFWLQPISWMLPPTYVFEGLRAVLIEHVIRWDLLAQGFAIDVAMFSLAAVAFGRFLKSARRAGTLLQTGE
ncbi:ABC transporter permease [Methylocystis iwaonis]|uniref:Transport permease protein n=1 Tax=Methylocystis iwaonis TaxID=2885079 RepID=A0ABM8E586_9HYPH|nr:ABC transporter permease [Methylocystis iwaonis]BDV33138.1 transport permease protein [Methylocystis iwaonis]